MAFGTYFKSLQKNRPKASTKPAARPSACGRQASRPRMPATGGNRLPACGRGAADAPPTLRDGPRAITLADRRSWDEYSETSFRSSQSARPRRSPRDAPRDGRPERCHTPDLCKRPTPRGPFAGSSLAISRLPSCRFDSLSTRIRRTDDPTKTVSEWDFRWARGPSEDYARPAATAVSPDETAALIASASISLVNGFPTTVDPARSGSSPWEP